MKKTTKTDTIRRCGHVWTSNDSYYGDDWHTTVDERFHPMTWKFGSIHQSKVFVDYKHLIKGKESTAPKIEGGLGICLRPGKTTKEAMQICLDWIEEFKQKGPSSVQEMFEESWDHWPTLYSKGNRISVIDYIFFVIGGGYSWVDGALMSTSPHDWMESRKNDEAYQKTKQAAKDIRELLKQCKIDQGEEPEDDWDDVHEKIWRMDVFRFYPVSENYSNICLVPDDVKPEWLSLAYEAALLLRDKSGVPDIKSKWYNNTEDDFKRQEENRKIGAIVVADLEKRFPHVKN